MNPLLRWTRGSERKPRINPFSNSSLKSFAALNQRGVPSKAPGPRRIHATRRRPKHPSRAVRSKLGPAPRQSTQVYQGQYGISMASKHSHVFRMGSRCCTTALDSGSSFVGLRFSVLVACFGKDIYRSWTALSCSLLGEGHVAGSKLAPPAARDATHLQLKCGFKPSKSPSSTLDNSKVATFLQRPWQACFVRWGCQ